MNLQKVADINYVERILECVGNAFIKFHIVHFIFFYYYFLYTYIILASIRTVTAWELFCPTSLVLRGGVCSYSYRNMQGHNERRVLVRACVFVARHRWKAGQPNIVGILNRM